MLVAVGAVLTMLALTVGASAQSAVDARIREAELGEDGFTRLVVSVNGDEVDETLDVSAFSVTENGESVTDITVEPLLESQVRPVAVQLVMDISGSTQGEPLQNAQEAATSFVGAVVPRGVQVGIIAFGETAEVRAPFSTDLAGLTAAIGSLEASGETALYDALVLASNQLARFDGQRNLVVFSDGGDTVSAATLEDALGALDATQAPLTAVALLTEEYDPVALDTLATSTGGRTLTVTDAEELASTFGEVARQLASQYVITYDGALTEPSEIELAVSVVTRTGEGSDTILVGNNRVAPAPAPQPVPVERNAMLTFFAKPWALAAGLAAAFAALALFLGVVISAPVAAASERKLVRGLRPYGLAGGERERPQLSSAELTRRAVEFVEGLPKPEGFEERLQGKIERAGWPMRASEFLLIQTAAAIVVAGTAWALSGQWLVGVIGLLVAPLVPYGIMMQRISKRSSTFLEQLPDTLQLLSGSLRAGYGLLQAIDTVVREAPEPTASEFSRVLTEARLGMPLDEALEGMAYRLDSEDFRWVVLAINIQRQVGGNLAHLLETVANTLRERAMVRRQIKTLSAEGRLSAMVLIALPFFMTIYMLIVNTQYMMLLFTRFMGIVMVVGALVLMVIGVLWMRKLIDIEV